MNMLGLFIYFRDREHMRVHVHVVGGGRNEGQREQTPC